MSRASYRQNMDEAQWLLAPLRRDRGTHTALDGVGHRFRIAPPPARQIFDGLDCGFMSDVIESAAIRRELRNTDQLNDRLADERPFGVKRERDRHDPNKAEPAAICYRALLRVDDQAAILVKPALRHFVDDTRRPGCKPDHVAIAAHQSLGYASPAGECGMFGKVQRLAMNRHHYARPHPAVKIFKFGPARMAGDVDEMGTIGDHFDALANKTIDDAAHGLFVTRNGARGKDPPVPLAERDVRMLVKRDARQRGAGLTLAAGTQRHHLVRRQIAVSIGAPKILDAVEITGLAGDLRGAVHGTPDQDDLAAAGMRRRRHRPYARHAGSNRRHRDAPGCTVDQFLERFGNVALRRRPPFPYRVGGLPDDGEAPGIAEVP